MKNRFIQLILVFSTLVTAFCTAQNYPLDEYPPDYPDYSHFKDLDNELDPYVGVFKATYNGKETTLYITKVEDKLEEGIKETFYRDALVVKYIVKDMNGAVLQDTKNASNTDIYLYSSGGTRPNFNDVVFYYSGTNCGVGWGKILMRKINEQQISWDYRPYSRLITNDNCPGNPDLTIHLPVKKGLVFTKQ